MRPQHLHPSPFPPLATPSAAAQQLEKLGRELKCPICLSLFKQTASLSCNHSFCMSCILQSIKMTPACPICKVPTTRREVRAAPQMDSLVTIYRSMESVAGISLLASQMTTCDATEKLKQIELDEGCITNTNKAGLSPDPPKKRQRCKHEQPNATNNITEDQNASPKQTLKGVIPAKKRVQVPQFSALSDDLGIDQQNTGTFLKGRKGLNCKAKKRVGKRKECQEGMNAGTGSTENAQCYASKRRDQSQIQHLKSKDKSWEPTKCSTLIKPAARLPDGNLSVDDLERAKLAPFFWLREESPQDIDCTQTEVQATQLAQTQASLQPAFSDLKDPDDNNFNGSVKEVAKDDPAHADSYDSDAIELTQSPPASQPRCSLSKEQERAYAQVKFGRGSNRLESSDARKDSKHAPLYANNLQVSESKEKLLESSGVICAFCQTTSNSELAGQMMHYKDGVPLKDEAGSLDKHVHVHRLCAEWAPDVYFVDGVARNLESEVARGQKIKCSSCGLRGAALGCCLKQCRRSYHYPCARAVSCRWDEDKFIILCPEHATCKFPHERGRKRHAATTTPLNTDAAKINVESARNVDPATGITSLKCSEKWPLCPASKWVLCGSALSSPQKEELASFAILTGATVTKAWSSNVTHIIAGTDDHGAARRTLKFLMATLEGKWIMTTDWMAACIATGKPVSEEPYEIRRDIHGMADGPKRGRFLAATKAPKLFEGIDFYILGEYVPAYKADLQALVVAAGGVLLHRKPVKMEGLMGHNRTIVIYCKDFPLSGASGDGGKELARRQADAKGLASLVGAGVASHLWILDSIAACEVQALEWYPQIS